MAAVSLASVVRRRGAVGVDVVHVPGGDPGVVQGQRHAAGGPFAFRGRGGDVIGVPRWWRSRSSRRRSWRPRRTARSRSSSTSMPEPSDMTNPSRSFSKGRLARSGSSLRVDRAFMAANPPSPSGGGGRLGAAGDDGVLPAFPNQVERLSQGVVARSARGGGGPVDPFQAVADGDLARRQVGDDLGMKNGEILRGPCFMYTSW